MTISSDIGIEIKRLGDWLDRNRGKLPREKLADVVGWIRKHSVDKALSGDRDAIYEKVRLAFSIDEDALAAVLHTDTKVRTSVKDDFLELIPKTGWFNDYIRYTEGSEPPTVFHFFTALTMVGACLKRQIRIPRGVLDPIFPNMVVFLVGPSGKVKKTTAGNIGFYNLALRTGRLRIITERITPEGLIDQLGDGDKADGLLYMGEIASSLTKAKYMQAMIPVLTRLWDCPPVYASGASTKSTRTLYDVALSCLGCTTETWLIKSVPSDAMTAGFTARVIQIYQADTTRRFPNPPPVDTTLEESLIERLGDTEFIQGDVRLTDKANKVYVDRYNEILDTIPGDEQLAPFHARVPQHIMRIAMLLRIAENNMQDRTDKDSIRIDLSHFEQADAIMHWVLKYLPKVYMPLGTTLTGEETQRILQLVDASGGRITRPRLIRLMKSRLTAKQLDERLNSLIEAEEIKATSDGLWIGYERIRPDD